jgi:hypothetical protein
VIRVAARVTIGGGRESAVRLALTSLGVAVGVTLLLFASVAFSALHQHDVRSGWTFTSEHNERPAQDESSTDPLLWRLSTDRFEGQEILRLDVAAEGSRAPVPSFLASLPGPGEIAASPAMESLLRTTDPGLLANRYPGSVTGTVGAQGLQSSEQLVIVIGHTVDDLRATGGAITVRSIEGAPVTHDFGQFLRVVLVIGAFGLLVPVLVFVSTSTRLAAARREQRLAAMRLAGATPRQVGVVAAVEAAATGSAGTVLGFGLFLLTRPYAARVPFDGQAFYLSDLHLTVEWAAIIAIGIPALSAAAALLSLRRIRISPLGVTRQTARPRPSGRRVVVLAGAVALFVVALVALPDNPSTLAIGLVGISFALIVVGIAVVGPWLTAIVARVLGRVGRRTPALLASRRLQDNPAAGFRAISGLVLAVFVASLVAALGASATASTHTLHAAIGTHDVAIVAHTAVGGDFGVRKVGEEPPTARGLDAQAATELLSGVRAIPGVEHVIDIRALPPTAALDGKPVVDANGSVRGYVYPAAGLVRCADAALLGLTQCTGTAAIDVDAQISGGQGSVLPIGVTVPESMLDNLPLLGLNVSTDGRNSTIERVRTRLSVAFPGASAITGGDLNAENRRELHDIERLSNVALLLTLLIAGCSLAVAVAGGLVERKRPFALLRLAGMPLGQLNRVVLAEAAAPLLVVAATSAALGIGVADIIVAVTANNRSFHLPTLDYWVALTAGLTAALAIVTATLPLLNRITSLETARFE